MENNDKIAEIRHDHRQLPDILYAVFKIIFSLISLKFFCTSAVGREETTGYWINRAEGLMHNDSIDEAISACGMAQKKEPWNDSIIVRKAMYLNIIGMVNESAKTYEKALTLLDEKLKKNAIDVEAWQWKAMVLGSLNREDESDQAYEKALEIFDQRIKNDSRDADSWIGRADVLLNLGRWDEARESYNRATELKPLDYSVWWRKAEVISGIGYINESVEAYDKAISLIPAYDAAERALAYAAKAEDLAFAERWEEALEAVDKSLELNPKSSVWWHFKASTLMELGRNDEALAAFDEALRQSPEDAHSWLRKAGLLVEMKCHNESIKAYDRTLELIAESNTKELAGIWLVKGTALNRIDRRKEAKEAFQMSLELHAKAILEDPGDLSLQRMKGLTLYNLGRYEESLEVYDQVLEASPRIEPYVIDVSALEGKGDALRALNRNQEALEAYNEAIALAPSSSAAWHGKGEAERALGQAGNAGMSLLMADKLGYEK